MMVVAKSSSLKHHNIYNIAHDVSQRINEPVQVNQIDDSLCVSACLTKSCADFDFNLCHIT